MKNLLTFVRQNKKYNFLSSFNIAMNNILVIPIEPDFVSYKNTSMYKSLTRVFAQQLILVSKIRLRCPIFFLLIFFNLLIVLLQPNHDIC